MRYEKHSKRLTTRQNLQKTDFRHIKKVEPWSLKRLNFVTCAAQKFEMQQKMTQIMFGMLHTPKNGKYPILRFSAKNAFL